MEDWEWEISEHMGRFLAAKVASTISPISLY